MPSDLVIAPPYFYCTQQDIENLLGADGALNTIDDLRNGAITANEQQMIVDAQTDSTCTIDFYCGFKYAPAMLATSPLINRWATVLGAYALRKHAGQSPPDSLVEWASEVEQKLEKILEGSALLPGVPLRRALAPSFSNTRLDPRFQFRVIRVETKNSGSGPRTSLPQNIDYQELYTREIR
jgi:hypothetical protein